MFSRNTSVRHGRFLQPELNSNDFGKARGLLPYANSAGSLLVCKEYELHLDEVRSQELGRPSYYTHPKYPMKFLGYSPAKDQDNWREYEPLENDRLFFEFASLRKGKRSPEKVLNWINEHAPLMLDAALVMNRHGYKWWGGNPREYVDDFYQEVDRAATIIALYEAVLGRNKEAVEEILTHEPTNFARQLYEEFWNWEPEDEKHYDGKLGFALNAVMFEVMRLKRTYSQQTMYLPPGRALPSRVRQGWEFQNLLGAMYVQMYWLLAAGEKNVTHCKYCGDLVPLTTRVIDSSKPSKSRKPRDDTEYCGKPCKQSYYYHTKGKYQRKSKRSSK